MHVHDVLTVLPEEFERIVSTQKQVRRIRAYENLRQVARRQNRIDVGPLLAKGIDVRVVMRLHTALQAAVADARECFADRLQIVSSPALAAAGVATPFAAAEIE